MALTPQNNQAFLREVDEKLRKDQATQFWQRYGKWLIACIVAALAILAGVLFWQHQKRVGIGREGEKLQLAFDDLSAGKMDAAAKPLAELAASKSVGYRAAARFSQADILLKNNDLKGAAAKFGAIAGDTTLAKPYRDLALIRQTYAEFDTIPADRVVSRLRGLAVPGNPWFGSAGELVAIAYLKQGKRDQAGRLFGQVASSESAAPSIRQRAVQMAGVLGVDAVPVPGTSGQQGKTE